MNDDAMTLPAVDQFWQARSVHDGVLPPLDPQVAASEFALLADNIPTLCWIARGDGYIVWYNKRWHDYCGTTPEAMEGWGWQKVHDPDELPRVSQRWAESVEAGKPFEMVFPLLGADGVFRPFLTRIVPMRDATGDVVRWFGTNTEIGAQVRAENAMRSSEAKYDVLTEAMPQMVWSTLPDGFHDYYNRQWYDFTGMPRGSTDGEGWADIFHPDDQPRAWDKWRHSLATGDPYEIEYRLRHHSGVYRWTLGRALPVRSPDGRITRWIGTCTDIHDAKVASEQNEILTRELSHRIKNIFAIIGSLVRMSVRRDPVATPFAKILLDRIQALGRAHEFARPHSDLSQPLMSETMLHGLLRELFRPYTDDGVPRMTISGANTDVDDKAATPVALLFHELATNAVKYGALAVADGHIDVAIADRDDRIIITWRETGGPAISGEPTHEGFGTRLARMSVEQQLGGTFERLWQPTGLVAIVTLKRSDLVRASL